VFEWTIPSKYKGSEAHFYDI